MRPPSQHILNISACEKMGFSDGKIMVDRSCAMYIAGDRLFGALKFSLHSSKSIKGIYMEFHGSAEVYFKNFQLSSCANEQYVHSKKYLIGGSDGLIDLEPGEYKLPFQFLIPKSAPPSFQGPFGSISYFLKAGLDLSLEKDFFIEMSIRVYTPCDLKNIPMCKDPVTLKLRNTFWGCGGEVRVDVRLPCSGFCPGQQIPVQIKCENNTNVDILGVVITIQKTVSYCAGRRYKLDMKPEMPLQEDKRGLGSVRAHTRRSWMSCLTLPVYFDSTYLGNCDIIKLEHFFKVRIFPKGWHKRVTTATKVIIGDIPLFTITELFADMFNIPTFETQNEWRRSSV